MARSRHSRAVAAARRVLRDFGVREPAHIDVEAMARDHGAEIVVGPLRGATARVVRFGAKASIRVSERISHPGARRFSVAHELGHLVLGHALPKHEPVSDPARFFESACRRPIGRGDRERDDPESEANAFAAELLMPDALVRRRCEVSPVSLAPVRAIAAEFGTSIVASAVRFVELTSERCAAVYAEQGRVRWTARSDTFSAEIARGMALDRRSIAFDYFRGEIPDTTEQEVPADAWLVDASEAEIVEHSQALPEVGAVLSMLWVPEHVAASLHMVE
jgi:hypothetical protein